MLEAPPPLSPYYVQSVQLAAHSSTLSLSLSVIFSFTHSLIRHARQRPSSNFESYISSATNQHHRLGTSCTAHAHPSAHHRSYPEPTTAVGAAHRSSVSSRGLVPEPPPTFSQLGCTGHITMHRRTRRAARCARQLMLTGRGWTSWARPSSGTAPPAVE